MRILILGSGNAATRFGLEFFRNGCRITGVYSRNLEKAKALSVQVDAPAFDSTEKLPLDQTDVILSALSDASATGVWSRISFGKLPVFHTAGSLPMDALAPYAENRGVIYPLQTLSRMREPEFRRIPLLIEASSADVLKLAHTLAALISDTVHETDSVSRKSLHLAAVFANNFTNHMYFLAQKIAEKNGVPFEYLLPLIDETAAKVHELAPHSAQTGPAVRGDQNIIGAQAERLRSEFPDDPDLAEIYELISRSIGKSFNRG